MSKQLAISSITDELALAVTHQKKLFQKIDRIIPWSECTGIIGLHDYTGERGNKPLGPELMLRIPLVQNLYSPSDMGAMIGRIRTLLEQGLQEKLFALGAGLLSSLLSNGKKQSN